MAESGWYMRNEVASYIPKWRSSVYANVDLGAVYGPSTDVLTGKFIAGTSLGMKGQFKSGLFYDVFVGVPLYNQVVIELTLSLQVSKLVYDSK